MMRAFLQTSWQDIRAWPLSAVRDRSWLAVALLILLPWFLLFLQRRELAALQPLLASLGLIGFYWLLGHRRAPEAAPLRRPRLELLVALLLIAGWIVFRVGEYAHLYAVPTFGLQPACGAIAETPVPKMVEMCLVPAAVLLALRYSWRQMGFGWDRFSWLAAGLPVLGLISVGLLNHSWTRLAQSSSCYFFAAGLPEEFLFRALLQTRLEALVRRPIWAVWIAAFLFGLSHLPIDLGPGFAHWPDALLTAFTVQMTVGFALGYAYRLTRSVLPLSLLHTLIDSAF